MKKKTLLGKEIFNTGVLEDPRSSAEKAKDWKYEEIAAGVDPLKPITSWDEYSIQNQTSSSSCVLQAMAKAHEVIRVRANKGKINHSAGAYAVRPNKPGLGTWVPWACQHAAENGIPFEEDIRSEGMSEAQMNAIPYLDLLKNIPNDRKTTSIGYLQMPLDFATIASEVQKGNPVLLLVRCGINEWNQAAPQVYEDYKDVSHEVCAVQSGLYTGQLRGNKGEKLFYNNTPVIRTDDSWGNLGFEGKGFRLLDEKFFKYAVINAVLIKEFVYQEVTIPKPSLPTNTVVFGQRNLNVEKLQECLKYLGYWPKDENTTTYFGNITRSNLLELQVDHIGFFMQRGIGIIDIEHIAGKSAGPITRDLLKYLIDNK